MDSIINISTNKLNIEFLEIHYQRNWMKKKIYIYIYIILGLFKLINLELNFWIYLIII